MKKILLFMVSVLIPMASFAGDGWPKNYGGVMLQGFSWDSYVDTQWTNLEKQADEMAEFFSLIWVPQSGNCNTTYNVMGYMPVYWYDHNSSFGTEAQLRKMIKTYKDKGVGIIEDVVINHRNNLGVGGSWVDYPAETYNGKTWQMLPTDICANDDGGNTKKWATSNGVTISSNNDTGEDWAGCRDLDHKSENVQANVKNYLAFLLNDMGYTGFRYDMTKGYSASFTGIYNNAANPQFSVGEYWDGNRDALINWLNGTKVNGVIQSATFDFNTRYSCRDAFNNNDWVKLDGTYGLAATDYRQYAVTFVENHDTQVRSATEKQDPLRKNIAAANAFIIGMPGTPCVFLPHWKEYKQEIKNMIYLRQMCGITNTSTHAVYSKNGPEVFKVEGDNAVMLVAAGEYEYSGSLYIKAIAGTNYSYWVKNDADFAWVDKASGSYAAESLSVTATALSKNSKTLVYTTDGSEPTAASATVEDGQTITLDKGEVTLKVGLLVNGVVKNIITRKYNIEPFVPHKATVYLKNPDWNEVYFYAWDSKQLLGDWPGTKKTQKKTIDGVEFYYHEFNITSQDYTFNISFNQGMNKQQTVDIGPIAKDTYYEIATMMGGKWTVNDITDQMPSGIESIEAQTAQTVSGTFNIAGQRVGDNYKGIVIKDGRKYLNK